VGEPDPAVWTSDVAGQGGEDLLETWWGDESAFSFVIDGTDLGAGDFTWTSWHTDKKDITGTMDIEFSVDGGTNWTLAFDDFDIISIRDDANPGPEIPNAASFQFTSNGTDDVWVRFTSDGTNATDFTVVNGFEVTVVPEPSAFALLVLSLALLASRRRRS